MAAHPTWEDKAFEESSYNTVPEDLGEQLQRFAHEEHLDGSQWRFTFAGPTRKYRTDQTSRDLFLEMTVEQVGVQAAAPVERVGRRPIAWIAAVIVAAILIALGFLYLRGRRTETRGTGPVTVAVLPFRLLVADPELRFLSIGIADSIITRLSNVRQMRVRPTTAILRYDQGSPDARAAGTALNCEYLLSGTLESVGERFRARVQLIRTSDGASVWGRQFDIGRGDLLSLEDRIAESVTAALPITVSASDRLQMKRGITGDPTAHEQYLRGRASLLLVTRSGTEEAIRSFESALRHDPNYARARAGLAIAAAQMRLRSAASDEVTMWEDRAKREALEALRLAPDLAEAHEALAAVYRHTEFDWDRTMEESTRAIALNANLELPHYYRAAAAMHLGLLDLARREARAGMEINPTRPLEALRLLGVVELLSGNYAAARGVLEEVAGRSDAADYYLGLADHFAGDERKAEEVLRQLGGGETRQLRAVAALASIVARRNREETESLLKTIEAAQRADHHVAYSAGAAYAQLGRNDDALRWLTRAAETGFPCAPWYERDPLLSPLRSDSRFTSLLTRLQRSRDAARSKYDRN
jgi:TolB-like protein